MYSCICNNISSDKLLKVIGQGAQTPEEVLGFYDSDFLCGICREHILEEVKKAQNLK